MEGQKSKSSILVIGGTGYIGKFIVAAGAREGHPTSVLVRDVAPSDPAKAALLQGFRDAGVTLLKVKPQTTWDLHDHESLLAAIRSVDVVISALSAMLVADQSRIVDAIKEAGHTKRFVPSEYGNDVDRTHAVDPAKSVFAGKARIRRTIEAEGIPYTYVCSGFFAGRFLPNLAQSGVRGLPSDKVVILGDGNVKGIFAVEDDVGIYIIKSVDDPRTLNKILYLRPPSNILSHNELVSLWEKKTAATFERVYVPEDEVLKKIQETFGQKIYASELPLPLDAILSVYHSVWIKGDMTSFQIEPSFGVEATELYPDVKYITVDEYLDKFL